MIVVVSSWAVFVHGDFGLVLGSPVRAEFCALVVPVPFVEERNVGVALDSGFRCQIPAKQFKFFTSEPSHQNLADCFCCGTRAFVEIVEQRLAPHGRMKGLKQRVPRCT